MVGTDAKPGGLPKSVFDDLQAQLAGNRSEFYSALPLGPFYGFNRHGVGSSEAIIENWWRQARDHRSHKWVVGTQGAQWVRSSGTGSFRTRSGRGRRARGKNRASSS
jgi:hypothetical protein